MQVLDVSIDDREWLEGMWSDMPTVSSRTRHAGSAPNVLRTSLPKHSSSPGDTAHSVPNESCRGSTALHAGSSGTATAHRTNVGDPTEIKTVLIRYIDSENQVIAATGANF